MLKFNKGENITSEEEFKNIFETVLRSRKTVNQFGQTIPNPNLKNDDPTLINTEVVLLEVFNDINCDQVINLSAYDWDEYENLFNELEDLGFNVDDHESGNTYNWSAPLTNHLNYRVFKNLESNQAFYMLEVHNGYSDIRGGYPLNFGFLVELSRFSEGSFVELFGENEATNKFFNIGNFNFSFDMFNESGMFQVYNDEIDLDDQIYIGDFNDCKIWVENEDKRSKILSIIDDFSQEQKNELGEDLESFVDFYDGFENSYFSKVDFDDIENYDFFNQAKKIKDRDYKIQLVNTIIEKCNWKLERHSFAPELNTLHIISKDSRVEDKELRTPKSRTIEEAKEYLVNWSHETELKKCLSSVYYSK